MSILRIATLYLAIFFLIACDEGPHAPNTFLQDPNVSGQEARLVFYGPINLIFSKRCTPCHIAGGGLPDWQNYQTAFRLRERIYQRVVLDHTMPPVAFSTITEEERRTVGQWIEMGAPAGSGPI